MLRIVETSNSDLSSLHVQPTFHYPSGRYTLSCLNPCSLRAIAAMLEKFMWLLVFTAPKWPNLLVDVGMVLSMGIIIANGIKSHHRGACILHK